MAKDRVLGAIRAVLRNVCGMTAQEAAAYTLHSGRHFLPLIAEARSEPPERASEVGRWSGSVAQDAGLCPLVRAAAAHQLRLRALPALYGTHSGVARSANIILDQLKAARALLARAHARRSPLPRHGGWHLLAQ